MMLFVIRSFTKPLEKVSTEQISFEKFFYSAIYLKYSLMILANFLTFKAHDSSKAFNKVVVVVIKRILWIRASCL